MVGAERRQISRPVVQTEDKEGGEGGEEEKEGEESQGRHKEGKRSSGSKGQSFFLNFHCKQ